jgi:hypothetical protein
VWASSSMIPSFPQLFEEDDVQINGWDEIIQEPTEHDKKDSMDRR